MTVLTVVSIMAALAVVPALAAFTALATLAALALALAAFIALPSLAAVRTWTAKLRVSHTSSYQRHWLETRKQPTPRATSPRELS